MVNSKSLETSPEVWKKYSEMVIIHVRQIMQSDANLINTRPGTYIFPAGKVFKQTVAQLFQWISGLLNINLPSRLMFEFGDVHVRLERRVILFHGDAKSLEAAKALALELFREIACLDPAVANVSILITPIFSVALGSGRQNMQQQLQRLHPTNITSNIPSDQLPSLPILNQNGSNIESNSARHPSTTTPGGPPPYGPSLQSQSSISRSPALDTTNSQGGPSKSAPSSMPTPHNKTTLERNIPNSNNVVEAYPPANSAPPRQPQQQTAQLPASNLTKIDNNTTSTATIVIRIQIDGHGRLSSSYDKSALNTRITSARFFA
jgi:hypothetical protein